MNALEKIREISKTLAASGIETADKEAEFLITHCLEITQVDLYKINLALSDKHITAIDEMTGRRCKREPLQYILGYSYFLGLKLLVGSGVLIPRPETELMAEYAIKICRGGVTPPLQGTRTISASRFTVLDLCTGSGCLALALAREFPEAQVYGTDISEVALGYARRNAELNKINNVTFLYGYLFEPFLMENPPASPFSKGGATSPLSRGVRDVSPSLAKRGEGRFINQNTFDLIISNPPYIKTDDIQTLQPEIREWEPLNALDGGADGLNFYREIISQAGKFLKPSGILMLELGAGCADETVYMMKNAGYADIKLRKDYAGIERIIQAKWTN